MAVDPYGSPRMEAEADAALAAAAPTFLAPKGPRSVGSYESKAMLGVAVQARTTGSADQLSDVRRGLEWLAAVEALPGTHLLGESWVVRHGHVQTVVSQPHVWEMTLFTMAALQAWGRGPA